jgi:hypothetical protein
VKALLLLIPVLLLSSCGGAGFPERKPGVRQPVEVTVGTTVTEFH